MQMISACRNRQAQRGNSEKTYEAKIPNSARPLVGYGSITRLYTRRRLPARRALQARDGLEPTSPRCHLTKTHLFR